MEILMIDRWLHLLAGVLWIGLLYYFNFVQIPALAEAGADSDGPGPAAISKYIAPRALLWFRWAALVTWITGAYYLYAASNYTLHGAFTLGIGDNNSQLTCIGLGAWLGTFMLYNVWMIIWPNQKKVLGFTDASEEEKARAKRMAFLASRANTVMSIPMLFFMHAAVKGLYF